MSPLRTTKHYRACNLCEAICGIEAEHSGSEIIAIRGDRDDPFSRGHICPKAVALKDIQEDPDRLRRPLRRHGTEWTEVGWPEALDEVAARLKSICGEHGRDALAVYLGNPNVHNLGVLLYGRLEKASRVAVVSRTGRVTAPLEISDRVMPGVVSLPHGWGHDRQGTRLATANSHPGASLNDLTDHREVDLLCGTAAVNGVAVRIERAPAAQVDG